MFHDTALQATKKLKKQIPRGLKSARVTIIKGFFGAAEAAPLQTSAPAACFRSLFSRSQTLFEAGFEHLLDRR